MQAYMGTLTYIHMFLHAHASYIHRIMYIAQVESLNPSLYHCLPRESWATSPVLTSHSVIEVVLPGHQDGGLYLSLCHEIVV